MRARDPIDGDGPRPTHRSRLNRQCWAVFVLLIAVCLAGVSESPAAKASQLGELEEPGEIERRPVDRAAENADAPDVGPDGSAKEDDAEDEGPVETPLHPVEEDVHEDEATEILPDSEAVDETIEEPTKPDEPEDPEKPTEPGEPQKPEEEKADRPAEVEPRSEPRWRIRWQNAFIVERDDDPTYQFLFGGRIQNDWGGYIPDNDVERSFGGNGTGTKFRRARLYFQGQFFRLGFFKAEYDFSSAGDGGTEFTDVYGGVSLPRIGLFRIGHFKEPFSLQFQSSSNFQSFVERAGIQAFSPQRNTGFMLNGNFLARDSTYAIGFFRRTDDVGEGFSNKEDYRLTGRFTFLPYFEEGGEQLLHVEFGYSHQFSDKNEGSRYNYFPGSDFAPDDVVDTGDLPVSHVDLFNIGIALVNGPLSLQGEVSITLPHDGIGARPVYWGSYAQVSWWLTGERRRYLRGRGVFSRVVPQNRFDPAKDQWGAFEVATRVSWLDLSDEGIRGGNLAEWTVAFNWVLFSNLRMTNNYILSRTGDRPGRESGLAHSWVTRFQLDF